MTTDGNAGSGQRFAPNFLLDLFNNPLDPGYGDAARRQAEFGPRPPWRRRGAYALKIITLVATGFLLAISYREVVISQPAENTAHAGLVTQVKDEQARTDALQQQDDKLRQQVSAAQQNLLGPQSAQLNQIRQQEAAIGLAAVNGPGVVVTLTDAPAPIDPNTGKANPAQVNRVLDVDIQTAVNGLWAGGAEAVSINGQRLTTTSTIRTAGSAVLVDFRPVASPYAISAIGPPQLSDRFDHSAAAADLRSLGTQYGIGFATATAANLQLPAATGTTLSYAHLPGSPAPSPSGGTK
jgi:uncharacterized protein YlxW (UPF0749 family)